MNAWKRAVRFHCSSHVKGPETQVTRKTYREANGKAGRFTERLGVSKTLVVRSDERSYFQGFSWGYLSCRYSIHLELTIKSLTTTITESVPSPKCRFNVGVSHLAMGIHWGVSHSNHTGPRSVLPIHKMTFWMIASWANRVTFRLHVHPIYLP